MIGHRTPFRENDIEVDFGGCLQRIELTVTTSYTKRKETCALL